MRMGILFRGLSMGRPPSMTNSNRSFELVELERILKVDQFAHAPSDGNLFSLHDGDPRGVSSSGTGRPMPPTLTDVRPDRQPRPGDLRSSTMQAFSTGARLIAHSTVLPFPLCAGQSAGVSLGIVSDHSGARIHSAPI